MLKPLYLCDRRKCKDCHSECSYTFDITHAKNFMNENGYFLEKEQQIIGTNWDWNDIEKTIKSIPVTCVADGIPPNAIREICGLPLIEDENSPK